MKSHKLCVCAALQIDKSKEWPSIAGEHFDCPKPKFDFTIIEKSFQEGTGYINYVAYSLTIPPEYLQITQVSGVCFKFVRSE